MFTRDKTKQIRIDKVTIGGGSPVAVQTMTNTQTADWKTTVAQIKKVEKAGADIVRVAVPDISAARVLGKIKKNISIPLVADIHFDWRLAVESVKQGADKIRINPGNIGSREKVRQVVLACKEAKIPIRIGINSGSVKNVSRKWEVGSRQSEVGSSILAEMMSATVADYVAMFEDWGFTNIVISLKASDVFSTIEAYKKTAEKINYPLHIGITEAGPAGSGTIKSAVGLGVLLHSGLGDTLRVSLTADPVEEVKAGYLILQSLNLRSYGIDLISCPTCARCSTNIEKLVKEFEKRITAQPGKLLNRSKPLKVAIMGCEVNGPGEARHADIGIAGGKNTGLLFIKGKPVKKLKPSEWINELLKQIKSRNASNF